MKTLKIALLASIAGFSANTLASGFGLYEMDAASTAMGGHVFGRPRNASAVYYNPGALSSMSGTVVTVGMTALNPQADANIDNKHDTHMNPGWIAVPSFFVVQELPWDFRLGVGGFADFGISSKYNNHWELKHDSTETLFEGYTIQTVLSRNITDKWSFGVGPRFTYVGFETEKMMLSQLPFGGHKLKIKVDNKDQIGIGLAAGTQYRFTDDFAAGVMYRSRVKTDVEGHSSWKGSTFNRSDKVKETLQLPAQVTVGFNWDNALWIDDLHLGASASWIEWSKLSVLQFDVFTPPAGPVAKQNLELHWRNTYRVGFGLGYDITDNWEIMAGYTYDWDPSRNRLGCTHSMLPVGDRHVPTTGIVWTSDDKKWELAFTYGIVIQEAKTQRQLSEALPSPPFPPQRVHSMHTHNTYAHIVSFGVTYRF